MMKKFMMDMRRDGSYNEPAERFFFDKSEITVYDSPDPVSLKASMREREFYGAKRTIHLIIEWEGDKPKVLVNGRNIEVE